MSVAEQNALLEQRKQKRFEIDAKVLVVAMEGDNGHIAATRMEGRALNVSASGALIRFDGPVSAKRIWVRLGDVDQSLSECMIVREAAPNQYGVRFACLWSADVLRELLDCVSHS